MNKEVLIFADPNSIHTKKWVDGWKMIGYSCQVSGLSSTNLENNLVFEANINVEGGNAKEFFKNIFKFKKVLKEQNPNIINAHYLTSYGLMSAILKRDKDTLVLFLPGTDVMQTMERNIVYMMMAKFVFSKSDLLVSVSNTMTQKILKYFPYLKDKIITQQYGIDTELLDKFQTTKKDIDILTNRAWVENSNYEILLDVFNKFSSNSKALASYKESDYSKHLKDKYPLLKDSIYNTMEYTKSVAFVGKCNIFISLTTSDGTPLSLLEAIYLGAIPIVSDLPTNREIIEDGRNGFIVSIDSDELYKKIKFALSLNENEIQKIQKINKELIHEKFQMKKNFHYMGQWIQERVR